MALTPTYEDMVRKWQRSHNTSRPRTLILVAQNPGYDLFYALVFGRYQKLDFDPHENYVECKQTSTYDTLILVDMEHCFAFDPLLVYFTHDCEAVIFVYHVSDRQSFLEPPSITETASNAITPKAAFSQPERGALGALGARLARRILSKLNLKHREAPPPPTIMALAVSDRDPKSKRPRQVTSEEGDSLSRSIGARSIGAIFVEVSCSWSSGVARG